MSSAWGLFWTIMYWHTNWLREQFSNKQTIHCIVGSLYYNFSNMNENAEKSLSMYSVCLPILRVLHLIITIFCIIFVSIQTYECLVKFNKESISSNQGINLPMFFKNVQHIFMWLNFIKRIQFQNVWAHIHFTWLSI